MGLVSVGMMGLGVADTTFVASASGPGNLTPGSGCGTMCTTHPIKASLLEILPLVFQKVCHSLPVFKRLETSTDMQTCFGVIR